MNQVRDRGKYFVWLDLEMTGLDPEHHTIIEIATIITDDQINIVATGPDLAIAQSTEALRTMEAWSKKTHQKSGLLDRVREEGISMNEAEDQTLLFVRRYCGEKQSPLCGNSIGHDRRFLLKYMPTLHDYFHYRNIDVSTIKELVRGWYPQNPSPQKKAAHRAMDDIQESISELLLYRATYFKPSLPPA